MYENPYPHLFSPIKIGKMFIKNRIFAAPASQPDVISGVYLRKENVMYYEARAKGGAAVVNLGDTVVHTRTGRAQPHKPLLDDPKVVPSLSDAARAIRQNGAIACLALSHCGKYANVSNMISQKLSDEKPYGPIEEVNDNGIQIYEMPEEIIQEIVDSFGKAAATAKKCGFEMVIIHGGHGWLLHQFMSPTNTRKDQYGGSFENRMRLTHMVLDSVRKAVGDGFPIEFRMSGEEGVPGGYTVEYGIQIAKSIESKIDLLHVSAGIHDVPEAFIVTHPDMFHPGRNVHLAAEIKKHVSIPVATLGGLNDPDVLEEIIKSGKADIVEMSRALMADPDLPNKARSGRKNEIVHCMRCFTCMAQIPTTRNMRCALNPRIGRELEFRNLPSKAKSSKKVLVVGGGPAGMYAAITASERGHDVTLCEASDSLGGQINCEKDIPFKKDLYAFKELLVGKVKSSTIDLRLGCTVTKEYAESLNADAVIIAVGAKPFLPPIPGIDSKIVVFADELRKDNPSFGETIAIIGGGLVGCETAVYLGMKGKKTTVVEMAANYAVDAPIFHKIAVKKQMDQFGVSLLLNTVAVAVTQEGLLVRKETGEEELIPADTVFCAAGMVARHDIVEDLLNVSPEVYSVGDCTRPGQMFWAISGGCFAALNL